MAVYLPADLRPEGGRSLREIAIEWEGRDRWAALLGRGGDWSGPDFSAVVPLHLDAGRDLAARALAEWCGLNVGSTAPTWHHNTLRVPPLGGQQAGSPRQDLMERRFVSEMSSGMKHLARPGCGRERLWVVIPGLPNNQPIEALRLACLHACGAS